MQEQLKFTVETIDRHTKRPEVIARAGNVLIAQGAYKAALALYGDRQALQLRHGTRRIEFHELKE